MAWYSVTLEGFTAHNETWDHVFEVDGKRDEVYIHHAVQLIDGEGRTIFATADRSPVLGDTNGFPNRVQAGTASSRGGIRTGDEVHYRRVLWQGDIPTGGAVAITPTIWEWDGRTDLLNSHGYLIEQSQPAVAKKLSEVALQHATQKPLSIKLTQIVLKAASLGMRVLNASLNDLTGQAKDRPIGMRNGAFDVQTLVLTADTAKLIADTSFTSRGLGVVPINYVDEPKLAGNYALYVKVQGIDLHDGMLVKESSAAAVFVIYGGAKFWIPDPTWLDRYGGWSKVTVVPDGALRSVPVIPRDGTVLREWSAAPVYVMRDARRCWISSAERLAQLGYTWSHVRVVPDGGLASIPVGPNA